MPRYSIAELIDRAQAGNIGYRGLRRLRTAGIDPSGLASSGVDPSGVPDPGEALDVRREGNFLRAIQRAQAVQAAGGNLSDPRYARTVARLHGGIETDPGVRLTSPDPTTFQGNTLAAMLEAYRKRRGGALSSSGAYNL